MKKKLFLLLLLLTIHCPINTTLAEQTESIPFLISSEQKQIEQTQVDGQQSSA